MDKGYYKNGRWIDEAWIVTLEQDGTWYCSVGYSLESAARTVQVMMMKYHPKRDMSQARIVHQPGVLLPHLEAPEYIDYSQPRHTPREAWAIEAPTRYQAIKIAKTDLMIATEQRKLLLQQVG